MAIKSKKKSLKPKKLVKKTPKNIVPSSPKKVQNEVSRILTQNKERMNLKEGHIPFASRFLASLLKEQEETLPTPPVGDDEIKTPDKFTPEGDKEAFDKSLEPETDKDEFETQGVSPDVTSQTINSIREWSVKLDQFAEFLNDPSSKSLHKILADGDRAGSLLRGVTRKASDSITRIAGEVEKLKEILNTYIITAPKKLRDTEQQTAGWTQY